MSRRATLILAMLIGGCHPVAPCRSGTLFVVLTAGRVAATADQLQILVDVGGGTLQAQLDYAGQTAPTFEIDFPHGYPAGQQVQVTVTATEQGAALARGSATTTLTAACARLAITFPGATAG